MKTSAVAAWAINLSLVVWVVFLSQRQEKPQEMDLKSSLTQLLSRQLEEESAALASDSQLKQELLQEAAAMEDITRRIEALRESRSPIRSLVETLQKQVSNEQRLMLEREVTLQEDVQETQRALRSAQTEDGRQKLQQQEQERQLKLQQKQQPWPQQLQQKFQEISLERATMVAELESGSFPPFLAQGTTGVLAGLDLTFASESISLALMLELGRRYFANSRQQEAADEDSEEDADIPPSDVADAGHPSAVSSVEIVLLGGGYVDTPAPYISSTFVSSISAGIATAVAGEAWRPEPPLLPAPAPRRLPVRVAVSNHARLTAKLRKITVVRFYGRWDDEQDWILLHTAKLKGMSSAFMAAVKNARPWAGRWSDHVLKFFVARSARGLVERRGWRRIADSTMAQVGRVFAFGCIVETAADRARGRVPVASELVLSLPRQMVL
mmetsp:Transcript_131211/g.419757  ORF Transcript_131211/g.419757 Transcript_131211/m.419757 type:complete len:440 (-) Transcript_131211:241-1560(-)